MELVANADDGRTIDPKPQSMSNKKFFIRAAIRQAWEGLGTHFYGWDLVRKVKAMTGLNVYDDTILRYMRELRDQGWIDYRVLNKPESLYEKRVLTYMEA